MVGDVADVGIGRRTVAGPRVQPSAVMTCAAGRHRGRRESKVLGGGRLLAAVRRRGRVVRVAAERRRRRRQRRPGGRAPPPPLQRHLFVVRVLVEVENVDDKVPRRTAHGGEGGRRQRRRWPGVHAAVTHGVVPGAAARRRHVEEHDRISGADVALHRRARV